MNVSFRYWLERMWGNGPRLVFVMLNPSIADQHVDDPTVRRCVGFAKRDGYAGIVVVNLISLRATDPHQLENLQWGEVKAPHQAEYDAWDEAFKQEGALVCGWGSGGRTRFVHRLVQYRTGIILHYANWHRRTLYCFGTTKSGMPRHPLYLPRTAKLQEWYCPALERT